MKPVLIAVTLFLWVAFPALALQSDGKSDEAVLEDVNAVEAVAIANRWKWSPKKITSHVDSRKVAFKFPDGKIKEIPLPEDKMVVALAPYIKETHT